VFAVRRWAGLLANLATVAVAVGGCADKIPPHIPTIIDPQGPLIEISRSALPVAPGADGTWHLLVPYHGIIGEGRRVARVGPGGEVRWSVDLPDRYALTGPDRGGYPAHLADGTTLLFLSGRPGSREPAAVMALDTESGRRLWEVELAPLRPGGSLHLANGSMTDVDDPGVPVVARCDAQGCDLRALAATDGRVLWSRQVPGAALVAGGLGPMTGGRGVWPVGAAEQPWIWAAGPGFLQAIGKVSGRLGGRTPLAASGAGIVITSHDRVVVVTAPHDGTCQATATGYAVLSDGGAARVWSVPFRWDDPGARSGPDGCRYDPARMLRQAFMVVLPDAEGALVINISDGAVRDRRPRGERHLAGFDLHWDGGRYIQRGLDDAVVVNAPGPRSGRPWGVDLGWGGWVLGSGDGATLVYRAEPLWHQAGGIGALALEIDRLAFLTPRELIVIGPRAPRQRP